MDAEVKQALSDAERALEAHFRARTADDAEPDWLAERRATDFSYLARNGLPNRRSESWRYTDLRRLMSDAYAPASHDEALKAAPKAGEADAIAALGGVKLVIVNGCFRADLSDMNDLPAGLEVRSFAEAAKDKDGVLANALGKAIGEGDEVIASLNGAFAEDGIVLRILDGAQIETPVRLVFIHEAAAPFAAHSRNMVMAGENARATIIETHAGRGDYQATSVTEFLLARDAVIDHIKVQDESRTALHLGLAAARLEEKAVLNSFVLSMGGRVARSQTHITFDGVRGEANASGALLVRGGRHADANLFVDHAVPNCVSKEVYKSVLDDNSRGVFQGRILVRPDAQKTDGRMSSRALLLSEKAEMDAKPELEIFADDVQCAHGATIGQLDEEQLFYMLSRGIDRETAKGLLVQAFAGEAIEEVSSEALRDALKGLVADWLARGEGRS